MTEALQIYAVTALGFFALSLAVAIKRPDVTSLHPMFFATATGLLWPLFLWVAIKTIARRLAA